MPRKSSGKYFSKSKAASWAARAGKVGGENARLRRPGRSEGLPPERASLLGLLRIWRCLWGSIRRLLADHAGDDANSHETSANQDDLQSDVHKNSLSFVRECRALRQGGHSRRGSSAPAFGASLTHEDVRYASLRSGETEGIMKRRRAGEATCPSFGKPWGGGDPPRASWANACQRIEQKEKAG